MDLPSINLDKSSESPPHPPAAFSDPNSDQLGKTKLMISLSKDSFSFNVIFSDPNSDQLGKILVNNMETFMLCHQETAQTRRLVRFVFSIQPNDL